MLLNKRCCAAHRAVNTIRLNKIANTNRPQLIELCQQIIEKEYENDDDFSINGIIAKEISKTTCKSFGRFSDVRNTTKVCRLNWIDSREGIPLDTQCVFINEAYGTDILPDQLASFMMQYDKGKSSFPAYAEVISLKKIFKEITGFNWNVSFVRKHIIPTCKTISDECLF